MLRIKYEVHYGILHIGCQIMCGSSYLSELTIGEIRKAIELLDENIAHKQNILLWLENDLPAFFLSDFACYY